MTLVTLLFSAHQPVRLKPYEERQGSVLLAPEKLFDLYFDEPLNRDIFGKVARDCYYPATRLMLELVCQHKDIEKPFKIAYGLSGTFLMQAQKYEPELIALFKELADTGLVEFTGETYYHSLCSLFDGNKQEFKDQVGKHSDTIEALFGKRPTIFLNTECLYNNTIADTIMRLDFEGIVTEGVPWLLEGWRSSDFVYRAPCSLPVLLRNTGLSEDIRFRFASPSWEHWPLTAEKFAGWLGEDTAANVTIAFNYEALGEQISADTGIFDFIRALPDAVKQHSQLAFATPSEAIRNLPPQGSLLVNDFATISWTDAERDTSAWVGNEMQQFAFEEIKRMELTVRATENAHFLEAWRLMQGSDHLYYLSDKGLGAGNVPRHFSAYGSLFEGFIRLQTALADLQHRAESYLKK